MKVSRVNGVTVFKNDDNETMYSLATIVQHLVNNKDVNVYLDDDYDIVLETGTVKTSINSNDDLLVVFEKDSAGDMFADLETFTLIHTKTMVRNLKVRYDEHFRKVLNEDFDEFDISL